MKNCKSMVEYTEVLRHGKTAEVTHWKNATPTWIRCANTARDIIIALGVLRPAGPIPADLLKSLN
jgi:hypothetical protein